jgi:hypothetical protein
MSLSSRKEKLLARPVSYAIAALVAATAGSAEAANWQFDPRVELSAIYNDNYRLSPDADSEIEVTGGGLDLELEWIAETPRSSFSIAPRSRLLRFPGEGSENTTDYFLRLQGEYRTQRARSGFRAQYSDESVVTSELLAPDFPGVDLGEPVGGDGGRVNVRNRRDLIWVNPWTFFEWTERSRLELQANFIDASYDDNLFEQVGFQDIRGIIGVEFDVSPRSTIAVRALVSQYSPDENFTDSTGTGFQAEWRTRSSATMRYYFRAGATRTERDAFGTTPKVSDTSLTAGAGVSWNYQVTRIVLDLLRSQEPSSAGVVETRDELRFRVNRDLRPRLGAFFSLRALRSEGAVEDVADVRDREYLTGTAGLEWRMSRQYTLRGAYDYAWQEFEGDPSDAQSNAVTLSVIYEPRRVN